MAVLDKKGKVMLYQTKAERIAELETVMGLIETAATVEEARAMALACRRTDQRWKQPSPWSFANVKAVEDAGG